jgi:transmembrane sensor
LQYNNAGKNGTEVLYNTLSTPRGRQFQLVLPDGSRVWLNSASSITFPTAFTGKDRLVKLEGEAYMEVAKDASHPFKVSINEMQVEVLGTHFNINGYVNEVLVKTTLLEGRVKVRSSATNQQAILVPGEQAQINRQNQTINKIKDVDVDAEVAWRFGNFQFNNADLKTVMRQLERWYDVEVVYNGEVPDREFLGTIPRRLNLSKVLTLLQGQNVHFKIDGKKIIVSPQ